MNALLDTHTLLWAVSDPKRLGEKAKAAILDEENALACSIASLWEIGIKLSLGKLDLEEHWRESLEREMQHNAIRWLGIAPDHCLRVAELPFHHRDPFDRMLVAQAQREGLTLLSRDERLDDYGVTRIW